MVLSVETLVNGVQTPMPRQVRSTSQGKDLAAIALLLSIVPEVSNQGVADFNSTENHYLHRCTNPIFSKSFLNSCYLCWRCMPRPEVLVCWWPTGDHCRLSAEVFLFSWNCISKSSKDTAESRHTAPRKWNRRNGRLIIRKNIQLNGPFPGKYTEVMWKRNRVFRFCLKQLVS